jgi:hypothetical protein
MLVDKNAVVYDCLAPLSMLLNVVDFRLRPKDGRFARSALLVVPEVDKFSLKRPEQSFRVFKLKRLQELEHLLHVKLMPMTNAISPVRINASPLSVAEPELIRTGRVL